MENNQKKAIGYKFKDERFKEPFKNLVENKFVFNVTGSQVFQVGSVYERLMEKYGLLDIWFNKVYEEDPIVECVEYEYKYINRPSSGK